MKTLLLILLLSTLNTTAQTLSQTLRGKILDKETQQPLIGVSIIIDNKGTESDINGNFRFDKQPLGRYTINFSMVGYNKLSLPNIELGSGKEIVLNVELTESPQFLKEVTIKAQRGKENPLNDLVMVSGRQFSVQESNRFAGGYGDPARMAYAFAGVASSGNDQNNEIVIRGNSPKGLLWRLEGVEIPNPNHFGDGQGSTSGIISMVNSASLANSDFMTGAFPAEYGNATSGVFDLRLRKGNDQKHEFMIQAGIIGLEASAEGPIKKGGASYRINARYSTLELLLKSGLLAIETGGFQPEYQDMNLTLNFPTKKAGTFSIFGLGGMNFSDDNDINVKEKNVSRMGVTGLTHKYPITNKGYFYSVLSFSNETNLHDEQRYINNTTWIQDSKQKYAYNNIRFSTLYNHRFSNRSSLRTGLIVSSLGYDLEDDRYDYTRNLVVGFLNDNSATQFIQAYSQWKYNISPKLSFTAGLHANRFMLNNNQTIEPRGGIRYQIDDKNTISAGFGQHSRLEPISLYLFKSRGKNDVFVQPNRSLEMTRANHYVLGYDRLLGENLRLKVETYYQWLYNVPVDSSSKSFFSMLNSTSGLTNTPLLNDGVGENYGLEITLEKYLSNNYYYLITGSLFQSAFKARDNIWRNTIFNNTYVANALAGKDFQIGKSKVHWLVLNGRLMWRGGNRIVPINLNESIKESTTIRDNSKAYKPKLPDYIRFDLGVAYRINKKHATWTMSIDMQNVTNRKNIIAERYDNTRKVIFYNYALPIIPIMNFKVEF